MKAEDLWCYRAELVHGIIRLDGTQAQPSQHRCRALLHVLIDQYVVNSKRGGASGEITIRDALVRHLKGHLNVEVDVASSDGHFEQLSAGIKKGRFRNAK